MRDQQTMMIERQAEIISKQNDELRTIRDKYDRKIHELIVKLKDEQVYGGFYRELQKTILDNPTLIDEWQRFCLLLKMTDPDQEKYDRIRGTY